MSENYGGATAGDNCRQEEEEEEEEEDVQEVVEHFF